jgi:hypothetical protein
MTVADLIEKLKTFPADMRVVMRDPEEYHHLEVMRVYSVKVVPAAGCLDEFEIYDPEHIRLDNSTPETVAFIDYYAPEDT